MPGRSVETNGAWPASTPKSPSAPGTSTCSTSPENTSFSGDTSSKCKFAIVCSDFDFAALDRKPQPEADEPTDQRDDRDVLHLAAGQLTAAASDIIAAHLDADRPEPNLGRFRPGEVARQSALSLIHISEPTRQAEI